MWRGVHLQRVGQADGQGQAPGDKYWAIACRQALCGWFGWLKKVLVKFVVYPMVTGTA